MKTTKKIVFMMCMIGVLLSLNTQSVSAGKVNTVKNPEVITDGKVSRTINLPNDQFEIEVSYGVGKMMFAECSMPMEIRVTSNANFNGIIRVLPATNYGGNIFAAGTELSLAKDTEKVVHFDQNKQFDGMEYYIEILDEKDEIIYMERDTLYTDWASEKYYILTLCDDFSGLAYFDGINAGGINNQLDTCLVELKSEEFPSKSCYLEPFKCIIMNNFDSSKFTEEQYNSLKQWVAGGGNLIVGLGVNGKNTLACFQDDFLQGTFGDITKKNVEIASAQNVDVMDFQLQDGQTNEALALGNMCQHRTIGNGTVVVLGFDLTMEPLASAKDKSMLSTGLIEWVASNNMNITSNRIRDYGSSSLSEIVSMTNETPVPSSVLYAIFFILYSVIVGPILYLVLKKKKKREIIWIAIPITSFVFTFLIWCVSSMSRLKNPVLCSLTIMNLNEGIIQENVLIDVVCPKAKPYSFKVDEAYEDLQPSISTYYNSSLLGGTQDAQQGEYNLLLEETNDGKMLKMNNTEPFASYMLTVEKNEVNDVGMLDVDIKYYADGIDGTVTNQSQYDLTNVIVYIDKQYVLIDSIAKGETVGIARDEMKEINTYNAFSNINEFNNIQKKKDKEILTRLSNVIVDECVDKTAIDTVYTWAMLGSYNPTIIKDDSVKSYGVAVLYQEDKVNYEDMDGYFCPNINKYMTTTSGDLNVDRGWIYDEMGEATYVMDSIGKLQYLKNENYHANNMSDEEVVDYADVYAFNIETGDYDKLFENADTVSAEELQKYLAGNVLILRYQNNLHDASMIPRISAQGEN